MSTVTINHTVKNHEANTRLDALIFALLHNKNKRFFLNDSDQEASQEQLSSISRATISQTVRSGEIFIGNQSVKPSYRVKTSDALSGTLALPEEVSGIKPDTDVSLPVLFENEHFVIIDKPAGILTHPTTAHESDTVANWAIAHDPRIALVGDNPLRPGIVHRLDQDTSGLLIIAKTQEAFVALKTAFQRHEIHKTYLAIIHGIPIPEKGCIDTPIARALRGNRQTTLSDNKKTRGKARAARTNYSLLKYTGRYSLIEAHPRTGRTHQIRVHLASIGHPVVGDTRYGTKATHIEDQAIPHHLLHATRLEFTLFGEKYTFLSPSPKNWPIIDYSTPSNA